MNMTGEMNPPLSKKCQMWMLGVAIAILCSLSSYANGNMIVNGGFERGNSGGNPIGWNAGKLVETSQGNHALLVPFTWAYHQTFAVQSNTRYLVSLKVKRHRGPSAARMVVIVKNKEGAKTVGGISQAHAFSTEGWERFTGIFTSSADAATATLYLLTLNKQDQSNFLADNVQVAALGTGPKTKGKIFSVPDPLYHSLFSDQPPGLVSQGSMIWAHMLVSKQLRVVAATMGRAYVEKKIFEQLAQYKLHPIGYNAKNPLYKKTGVSIIYIPKHYADDIPSMLDPRAVQAYIAKTKWTLEKYPEQIWGVFAGDEQFETAIRQILDLRDHPEEAKQYDYFKTIKNQVKQQYGFGKYGLPTGEAGPKEKFRWIALRRWVAARLRKRSDKLKQLVEQVAPDVKLISIDPQAHMTPNEQSRVADVFDIFTHQFMPPTNPNRPTVGFHTKLLVDLTGKEVWPCVHVEHWYMHATPKQIRKIYSQVWRNGGDGFHLYIPDTAGAKEKKGDTRLTRWGAPLRFKAIMQTIKRTMQQPKLRFPADEGCRIFYSQYSFMAGEKPDAHQQPLESSFMMLGPRVRSWFKFIDEYRLAHPLGNKSPRVIYLPYGPIIDQKTRQRLEVFVKNGGMLIVADPQAFSYGINGQDTSAQREQLVGAKLGHTAAAGNVIFPPDPLLSGIDSPLKLKMFSTAHIVKPGENTQVIGHYQNGKPAVVSHKLGRGQVIYFGFQPFSYASSTMKGWQKLFKALQHGLDIKTGLNIWRFAFPKFKSLAPAPPAGVCLTGNHAIWREDKMHPHQNIKTSGTYSLSPKPDVAADTGGVKNIPFTKGDLTDRTNWPNLAKVKAASYQPYDQPLSDWVDTWSADHKPVTIRFDFKKEYSLDQAKVWYSGAFKQMTLSGSHDGIHWTKLGQTAGQNAGADVMLATIKTEFLEPYRYARLTLTRAENQPLSIAELEVWGEDGRR